jgi:YidC/Oxa1 family membrane protein insertase
LGAIWSSLIGIVEQVLVFLYGFTHNYGIAIILLTIIIRVLMYPLMQKQMTSMMETQRIQPLMKEIQTKYKNDKEKMNQELMRLYKEHNVNPMGGCLPLLIQMPILILFFQVLREFKYLDPVSDKVAGGFLWIQNEILYQGEMVAGLAAPDKLFGSIAFSGTEYFIGILPILVGATMYIQQKLTTPALPDSSNNSSSSNPAAGTQKMMTTIMPLMIGFISFTLPSGLSLYWVTSTVFGIGQQILINKKKETIQKVPKTIEEEVTKKEEKIVKTKEGKNKPKLKPENIKEEVSWIPGYENPSSQVNKNRKKQKTNK